METPLLALFGFSPLLTFVGLIFHLLPLFLFPHQISLRPNNTNETFTSARFFPPLLSPLSSPLPSPVKRSLLLRTPPVLYLSLFFSVWFFCGSYPFEGFSTFSAPSFRCQLLLMVGGWALLLRHRAYFPPFLNDLVSLPSCPP